MSDKTKTDSIVLHLIVVGFHHKKGCLVEYCYPPIDNQKNEDSVDRSCPPVKSGDNEANDKTDQRTNDQNSSTEPVVLPHIWRTLPSLALPDGSHNHERDAIYFHLPDIDDHNRTIYGVSCYRQISANKLIARTSDVTRGTVQKSVVVLSRLPLYGLIESKLDLITHAYFRELDFSKVSLLEETYHNLNAQLNTGLMNSSMELYVGLSPRQLVSTFHHKIVVLFKLLLLERKVLFYKSPVKELCVSILSLCSLMPGLIGKGLTSCSVSVHPKDGRQLSTDVELSPGYANSDEFFVLATGHNNFTGEKTNENEVTPDTVDTHCSKVENISQVIGNESTDVKNEDSDEDLLKEIDAALSDKTSNSLSNKSSPAKDRKEPESMSRFYDQNEPKPERVDKMDETSVRTETPPLLKLADEECGLPLEIFSCGAYLQPYLSLTYLDVLTDVRVRSCLVGATNFLFKQKKDVFDVVVELDGGKIELLDPELKKLLALTTEDLRFADFLVKTVLSDTELENGDLFAADDNVGWEGSDEWIRYQFKIYLLHMLRSSEMDENSKDFISFNTNFMTTWRSTHNYKMWSSVSHPSVFEVTSGHPFGGQLSVSDMRLKFSQIFYSKSDQNKKINQTVSRTSKAVGGAVVTAKTAISSAVTSFWNSWSAPKSSETATNSKSKPEAETQL